MKRGDTPYAPFSTVAGREMQRIENWRAMTTLYEGFFTVSEAAEKLCVHRCTISRHIASGELAAYRHAKNGRVRLVDASDVEAIQRVTRERGRKRNDWSGPDWMTRLLEAHADRSPDRKAETLLALNIPSDIWPENPLPPLERTVPVAQPWDDDDDDDD